jgi:hypothetical protein
MRRLLVGLPILIAASPALACSQQEAQAKAMQVTSELQQLASTNPQAVAEWGKKVQAEAQAAIKMDETCALFDRYIAEIKASK